MAPRRRSAAAAVSCAAARTRPLPSLLPAAACCVCSALVVVFVGVKMMIELIRAPRLAWVLPAVLLVVLVLLAAALLELNKLKVRARLLHQLGDALLACCVVGQNMSCCCQPPLPPSPTRTQCRRCLCLAARLSQLERRGQYRAASHTFDRSSVTASQMFKGPPQGPTGTDVGAPLASSNPAPSQAV